MPVFDLQIFHFRPKSVSKCAGISAFDRMIELRTGILRAVHLLDCRLLAMVLQTGRILSFA